VSLWLRRETVLLDPPHWPDYSLIVPSTGRYVRFGIAIAVIVAALSYLAFTGIQESKSYYVTVKELRGMGEQSHSKRLRVAGLVVPGSIRRQGTGADFQLDELGLKLQVAYRGSEPPPDTFKDNAQALVEGSYGSDGIFHAKQIQAKCASKYAPAAAGQSTSAGEMQPAAPDQKAN
jgi:cytochrome c-type biogenesis protein CcmE